MKTIKKIVSWIFGRFFPVAGKILAISFVVGIGCIVIWGISEAEMVSFIQAALILLWRAALIVLGLIVMMGILFGIEYLIERIKDWANSE